MRITRNTDHLELQQRITLLSRYFIALFVVATLAALFFSSLFACSSPVDAGGRTSGNSFSAAIYVQGNPNGKVSAAKGTIGADERTGNLYENTNGAKTWVSLLAGLGGGDITSIVAGDGLTGDCTSGACTIDAVCGAGLSCLPDAIDIRDDCIAGDTIIFAPEGEGPNAWQCAHGVSTDYRLDRYVVATTNGGLGVTMDDTDTTARKAFVNLQDCATGEVLKDTGVGTWACAADSTGTSLPSFTDDGSAVQVSPSSTLGVTASGAAGNAVQLYTPNGGVSVTASGTGTNGIIQLASTASTSAGSVTLSSTSGGIQLTAGGAGAAGRVAMTSAGDGVYADGSRIVTTAGTGLSKSGATLTVNIAGASCSAGQAVTAIGATGSGTCSAVGATETTTAPTLGTCGTGPTVTARNIAFSTNRIVSFRVAHGTGSATACTATFASAFSAAPACNVTVGASTARPSATASTTAVTWDTLTTILDGTTTMVTCIGPI